MIKFNFKKDTDRMFTNNKMLYVISNNFHKRMQYVLKKVKKNKFKKILIIVEKNKLRETILLISTLKLNEQIIVVNYESLKKVINLNVNSFKLLLTINSLKDYATKCNDTKNIPVIIRGNFKKPDVIVIDSAHRLGAYPKLTKVAQDVRKLSNGIPILASGFTILANGKLPKLFNQLHALNRTREKNFYTFAKKFINIKDISSRYSIINNYDELNVKGKLWYDNIINKITINIDNKEYEDNDIIHTLPLGKEISSMVEELYQTNILKYKGVKYNTLENETRHKYIHQLLSGTIKLGSKYFIIDDFKAKFIKQEYKNKKILIIYKYLSEKTIIERTFKNNKNITVIGYIDNLPKEEYDYIIFYTLTTNITKYQNIISTYNNIKKVYIFSRNSMEADIYNKLKMQLNFF